MLPWLLACTPADCADGWTRDADGTCIPVPAGGSTATTPTGTAASTTSGGTTPATTGSPTSTSGGTTPCTDGPFTLSGRILAGPPEGALVQVLVWPEDATTEDHWPDPELGEPWFVEELTFEGPGMAWSLTGELDQDRLVTTLFAIADGDLDGDPWNDLRDRYNDGNPFELRPCEVIDGIDFDLRL